MKYDIVNDIKYGLEMQLSDFEKSVLSMLSGSKIDDIDGLKLDIAGTRLLKEKPAEKELLFSSKSGKKYVALMSKNFNHFNFCEIADEYPEFEIEMYNKHGALHNRFLVKVYYNDKRISFVDGKNVIDVRSSNPSQYTVDIYANTDDVSESNGLIPDDKFSFSYYVNNFGQGELVYSDSKENVCTLFPVMGDQNPLYIMWRIGRAVNSLYTQSYIDEAPKQLTREHE